MLEKAIIIAMIVFGLHYIMSTKTMLLYFVREWAEKNDIPGWATDPLYGCPICQVPYYGTLIYWLFLGNDWKEWLVCIFTAMGINSVIVWSSSYRSK